MAATESNSHQDGASEPKIGSSAAPERARGPRLDPLSSLLAAVTFGLATGLLELLSLVIRVKLFEKGFFLRSRHFVWMVPVSDLAIFGSVGLALALVSWSTGWLTMRGVVRVLLFLACISLLLLVRGLNSLASALLAAGVALRVAPWVEARLRRSWSRVHWGAGALAVVLVLLLGQAIARDMSSRYLAKGRPPLRPGQVPNILLIVLDTVRADRLSLYGYGRDTTPNLARLADQGVRFDRARASAPWTLPSHASLFTARWPHELDVERLGRLDTTCTTLAEFLGARGYATAGFVANQFYCGHESGLARGFDSYEDFPVNAPEVLRASSLGWLLSRVAARLGGELGWWLSGDAAGTVTLDFTRKDARAINREFLDWLSTHGETPFFAFLNYFDAHDPYLTPRGATSRCAAVPKSRTDFAMLRDWQKLDKHALSPRDIQLARDGYDNCIASLDHELGRLIGELESRGVLEQTLLILTADHGEQFGEHGDFGHGFSLYEPEIHVPLVVVFPGRVPRGRVAGEAVSLRDVPATVIDLLGSQGDSPFPGTSLAAAWRPQPDQHSGSSRTTFSELDAPIEDLPGPRNKATFDGPIQAVVSDGNVYIRHGSGAEELYNLDADPTESQNQSGKQAAGPILDRCRRILDQLIPSTRQPSASARHPLRDLPGTVSAVAQMGRRGGTHPRLGRGVGPLPAANAFDPVGQVQQLAIGLVVKILTLPRIAPQDPLLLRWFAPLWGQLIPPAVDVDRTLGPHERDHRAQGGVRERPLEMSLHVVRVFQDALDRVGSLPEILAGEVVADRCGLLRMFDLQDPMGHVDPVDHQVGEQPAAEVPEPAPVSEAILIERLRGSRPKEVLPGHLTGIDPQRRAVKPRGAAAVPAQVDLENVTDPSALDQLARFLDVGHAPLLHADLYDLPVPILRRDDRRAFGRIMRQGFFDVDVLPRVAAVDRHRHVPVVGAADQDGVDVLAVENLAIMLGGESLRIRELLRCIEVGVINVADRGDPDPGNVCQRFHQGAAPPARAQAADVHGVIGREAQRRFECGPRTERGSADAADGPEEGAPRGGAPCHDASPGPGMI